LAKEWTSLFGHDWEDPFYPFIKNFGIGVSLENGAGHIRLCSDLGCFRNGSIPNSRSTTQNLTKKLKF